jgi:hypothetical protein
MTISSIKRGVIDDSMLLGLPGAMAAPTATASGASVSIAFTAVSGATSYSIVSSPATTTQTASSSPYTFTGLTVGTSYTFSIAATNAIGQGGFSQASNSVTPDYPSFIATNTSLYVNNLNVDSNQITYIGGGFPTRSQNIASDGTVVFTRSYGNPSGWDFTSGVGVSFDASKNLYYTGFGRITSGNRVGILVNTNSTGNLEFNRRLSGSGDISYYQNAIDSLGNIYSVGYSTPSANALLVVKYNSSGTLQWQKELGATGNAGGSSYSGLGNTNVVVDSTGNYIYFAFNSDFHTASRSGYVIKMETSTGNITWQRRFYGTNNGGGIDAAAVCRDSSDNVYVNFGAVKTASSAYERMFTAKWNSSGTLQWQRTYLPPSTGSDSSYAGITCEPDGTVYACTSQDGVYSPGKSGWVVKYDTSGTVQWQRYWKQTGSQTNVTCVFVQGNYLTVGPTQSSTFLLRVPKDGSKTGSYSFNGGTWTWGIPTGTVSTGDATETAGSITIRTSTYTDAAFSFSTDTAVSTTSTVTII